MEEMSVRLGIDYSATIEYIDCNAIIGRIFFMASLTVRNIPDEAKRRFRQRAARHGRSMEEEARQLILKSVAADESPRRSIGEMLFEMSRPGVELPMPPRSLARIPDFDDE
jgi:plasmid stability protein